LLMVNCQLSIVNGLVGDLSFWEWELWCGGNGRFGSRLVFAFSA